MHAAIALSTRLTVQTLHACPSAVEPLGVLPPVAENAAYVPFLGCVIECRTNDEAQEVADASTALRSADFARLATEELDLLLATIIVRSGDVVRQAIRERANELARLS